MTHTQRLKMLTDRGWTCSHPERKHPAYDHTGKVVRPSVYLEGTIESVPSQIHLAVEDGYVMRLATTDDFLFQDFIDMLDGKGKPIVKASEKTRTLFDVDDE